MNEKGNGFSEWASIESQVLDGLNIEEPANRFAVDEWRKHVAKVQGACEAGEVVHTFTAPDVVAAAVAFFKADIADNRAVFQIKIARNARLRKLMELKAALGESQGVFVDDDEDKHIVPERLAVIRITESEKKKMLQQVVQASLNAANGQNDNNGEEPGWPTGLGDGIHAFAEDLTEFINNNGTEGREMVERVCIDRNFAKTVTKDEEMPKPIRFLAQVAMESNADTCLPAKERRIGFGNRE